MKCLTLFIKFFFVCLKNHANLLILIKSYPLQIKNKPFYSFKWKIKVKVMRSFSSYYYLLLNNELYFLGMFFLRLLHFKDNFFNVCR